MVITTNILDRPALCEQVTERTVSRLTEMCDEVPILGHDRRMDMRVPEPTGEASGRQAFAQWD
jgi:phosphoenolpyruvate carboxylase